MTAFIFIAAMLASIPKLTIALVTGIITVYFINNRGLRK